MKVDQCLTISTFFTQIFRSQNRTSTPSSYRNSNWTPSSYRNSNWTPSSYRNSNWSSYRNSNWNLHSKSLMYYPNVLSTMNSSLYYPIVLSTLNSSLYYPFWKHSLLLYILYCTIYTMDQINECIYTIILLLTIYNIIDHWIL